MSNSKLNMPGLKLAEWFAENAYIAPGKHRLQTALGLMAGLYTGREMMNILTGQDGYGDAVDPNRLLPPLRRFHGTLAYNRFEDTDYAKWHKVADAFVPMFFGAIGAMAGSAHFARATPIVRNLKLDLAKGSKHFGLAHADMLANKKQAETLNYLAGLGLNMGSTSGVHLFPTMLASSTSAFRFQLDHGKNIILPGLRALSGNRGHSSRNMLASLNDFVSWAQNNAAHYTGSAWYKNEMQPLMKYSKDMLQLFKEATPEQRQLVEQRLEAVCSELDALAKAKASETGLQGEALVKELSRPGSPFDAKIKTFIHEGLEQSFIDAKLLDPNNLEASMKNVALGDYGIISRALDMFGARNTVPDYRNQFVKSFQQRRSGETTHHRVEKLLPRDGVPYLLGAGAVTSTLAAMQLFGENDAPPETLPSSFAAQSSDLPRHEQAEIAHQLLDSQKKNGWKGVVNGKPLDTLSWMSSVLVVPPGLHRFMNAAFLSGFLWGGAKVSSTLAARDLRGATLALEEVPALLKPLHGKMAYVWKSSNPADRWKHVAHQLLPVGIGMPGTYLGSRLYFQDRIDNAQHAEYLEDFTDRILMEESEIYARGSAVTSILNTGSGFHMLPFVSYPSNLQNRFLMAQGQQIASPGVGKWWSGNPSKYPWHVKKQLNVLVNYAVGNSSEFPREFAPMSEALIAKLYPDLPEAELAQKRDAFVDKLYAVRDQYWKPGGVPEEQKSACKQALEASFRREGLERTLTEIGLNPLEAKLDHNGMGGKVARFLGANDNVERSIASYHRKAAERMDAQDKPDTTIKGPAPEPERLAENQLARQ